MTKKESIAKLVCCDIDGILKGKLVIEGNGKWN